MALVKNVSRYAPKILKYRIGQILPTLNESSRKIRIGHFELDTFLKMYFEEYKFVYAHDPLNCKVGDFVLVRKLPEKMTRLITHEITSVIFEFGDVTCPITNKKVYRDKYREFVKKENEEYGENPNAFDYDKAGPRGRLYGIRDFSDKPTYRKYYDDPNEPQPYAI